MGVPGVDERGRGRGRRREGGVGGESHLHPLLRKMRVEVGQVGECGHLG